MAEQVQLEFRLQPKEESCIPENVAVRCPATRPERFKMRRANKACPKCDAFLGVYIIENVTAQQAKTWESTHQICCFHPIARRCFNTEVIEK